MLFTDLGYDHLYSLDDKLNLGIVYNFTRGFGPRHFAINSYNLIFVIGETTPSIIALNENFEY